MPLRCPASCCPHRLTHMCPKHRNLILDSNKEAAAHIITGLSLRITRFGRSGANRILERGRLLPGLWSVFPASANLSFHSSELFFRLFNSWRPCWPGAFACGFARLTAEAPMLSLSSCYYTLLSRFQWTACAWAAQFTPETKTATINCPRGRSGWTRFVRGLVHFLLLHLLCCLFISHRERPRAQDNLL